MNKFMCVFLMIACSYPILTQASLTPAGQAFYDKYKKSVGTQYHYNKETYDKTSSPYTSSNYALNTSDRVIDFGGYGVVNYEAPQHSYTSFYLVEFTPNLFIRYKDQFEWGSQIQFSLFNNGSTRTDLQFAYLDWFITPCLTLEFGKFFSPEGKFINTYYIPYINKLPSDPVGFGYWEVAPEEDIGIQAKARFLLDGKALSINAFVTNGPRVAVSSTNEYLYMLGNGYPDTDGHKAFGARIGYFPCTNLEIGVSGATGQVGLFLDNTMIESERSYHSLGMDLSYYYNDITFLAEVIDQIIGSKSTSTIPQSAHFSAWYTQLSYLFKEKWEPVARIGQFNTPNIDYRTKQYAIGLDYWFTKTIVAKIAYEINNGKTLATNSNVFILQFVYGF